MKYRIIDVSMWMNDFVFPENPEVKPEGPFNRISAQTAREFVYDFKCCTQSGTHIQGAHYFLENGKRINEYEPGSFEGEAIVVDINKRGEDTTGEELEKLIGTDNLEGRILILRTGHMQEIIEKKLENSKRPGISLDAAKYLAETKKIKMIAIDSIGVESRTTKNYEVNTYLCKNNILILEGLVNLDKISGKRVFLEAYPLKIKGVEGTPCRAIVKEEIGQ